MLRYGSTFRASIRRGAQVVAARWAGESPLLLAPQFCVVQPIINARYPGFQTRAEHDDQIEQCRKETGEFGIGQSSFTMISRPQLWETDPSRQQCNGWQPFKETRMGPDAHGRLGLRNGVLRL